MKVGDPVRTDLVGGIGGVVRRVQWGVRPVIVTSSGEIISGSGPPVELIYVAWGVRV